jgi:cell division protein FtsZ
MSEMGKAMMGTGEGEGENRALDAAERAIANPLLDGVSMQGAKGVIISIIGGDDMKLLEVDEAANHIRELVDPDANIIWGSAFNPELQGKIRVSVVATGIEPSTEQVARASQSAAFATGRAPKRPVLPLPTEDELAEDTSVAEVPAEPEPELAAEPEPVEAPAPRMPEIYDPLPQADAGDDEYDEDEEEYDETSGAAYASLTGDAIHIDAGADGEEAVEDDWDQPAADDGAAPFELTLEAEQAQDDGYGAEAPAAAQEAPPADELLLDASSLADEDGAADMPMGRRRRLVSGDDAAGGGFGGGGGGGGAGGGGGGGSPGAGSTLFERMANFSRGAGKDEDEDEDDEGGGGPSLNIPRFLGRQNNQ